jgi:lipopolysaccharide heptosyltransferase II
MKLTVSRVVVFAPNWLGDSVMALPAIADLGRALPAGTLTIAARPTIAPLFSLLPAIGDVALWSKRGPEMRSPASTAILLPNSFQSALAAWRAGIGERWGYRTDWRRALLTRAIEPPTGVHQVEYYQRLVRALGFANGPGRPHIPLSDELRESGAEQLRGVGWDGREPLLAIAPGAAYGGSKRWPPDYFAGLVRSLAEDGVRAVMVGSRADLPVGREIEAALEPLRGLPLLNLMGTDLPTLAGVLANCRALVSNDSGAMHLAVALGVRVTAVYGPTDERMTRPLGDAHTVLTNPVWCRPCWLRECPIDHRCMRGIGVDRVAGAVRQML